MELEKSIVCYGKDAIAQKNIAIHGHLLFSSPQLEIFRKGKTFFFFYYKEGEIKCEVFQTVE